MSTGNIVSCLLAGCALLLSWGCVSSTASSGARHQAGVVKASGGKPCFSVGDNRETRSSGPLITLIDLYKRVDGHAERIWEKSFGAETGAVVKRLQPGECIEYPGRGGGHGQTLVPGQAYSATLWASLTLDGEAQSRWYHIYFCMIESDNGLVPHQVLGDDWSACGVGVRW
ncbi:hypothetical protein [Luteimonas lutimaris]|uniref:hypothetical protein n=1 Tax=Luteimonas lutimaris TaxID=698645 RepID=UPI0031DE34F7